ncbi:nitrile hydratase subunit alpha [Alphaproteobacteria bacterium]|jgi:nitrile hydratase|nr:nitrile hydratase subunit alpha [Alphaproteobacteria bacterium]MDA9806483.1 nitrile hydratase subunit alpha [Alphaproteobacteria bacterium]MDB2388164.1 nitrile hydratase subunit alpha [Alphaproteobacteria bacterium]MDC1035135.1 nitrile hydratase subunit alpha [Alphaproteobacteria bacterium]MDC6452536.1 nitrile hydratase subunit alpha [Alphaproteobacteria bacterium]
MNSKENNHSHHDHEHDHAHSHLPSDPELRVKAIETLLLSKGLIDPNTLDELIDTYENNIGPQNGAKVVAKAWVDNDYKKRLLEDATSAIRELSYQGRQGENMVVVENTPEIHNVVVCTLCSCYPWPVLGIPPTWYKSDEYRSRAVREPRKVLSEFGLNIDSKVQIKVWDSTAELRYLVLPMRPIGSENMSEAELAKLVTRNSMIGTGLPENVK